MNGIYSFGEFRLDSGRRLLSRNGDPVVPTPMAFDLLLALSWIAATGCFPRTSRSKRSGRKRSSRRESSSTTSPCCARRSAARGYRFAGDVEQETAVEIALAEKTEVAVEVRDEPRFQALLRRMRLE